MSPGPPHDGHMSGMTRQLMTSHSNARLRTSYSGSGAGAIVQIVDLDSPAAVGTVGIGGRVEGNDVGAVRVDLAASSGVSILLPRVSLFGPLQRHLAN